MRLARERFFGNLLHASTPDGPCTVIITMRADFYPHAAAYPAFAQAVSTHQYLVGPLGRDELRQVIEQPALAAGTGAAARPGRGRARRRRTRAGGVAAARARAVGAVGATPGRHAHARRPTPRPAGWPARCRHGPIRSGRRSPPPNRPRPSRSCCDSTQPGEGAEDTRRPATVAEIATATVAADDVERVVQQLADARLVTTSGGGRPVVEVAHEALDPGLAPAARDGSTRAERTCAPGNGSAGPPPNGTDGGSDESLWRGARLATALEWAAANPGELNERETASWRQPSRRARPDPPPPPPPRHGARLPHRAHDHRGRPRRRRRRRQPGEHRRQRGTRSPRNRPAIASARALAAQARRVQATNPALALALAAESTVAHRSAARRGDAGAVQRPRRVRQPLLAARRRTPHRPRRRRVGVAFNPDGTLLASAGAMARCGCGTRPPATPSANPSPATTAPCAGWRSTPTAPCSPPPASMGRCGCGTRPPATPSANRSPATTAP